MKKPFKLDAYYLVDCSGISQNSATERAGLDTESQVVFYADSKLYYVDDDNDLMVDGSGCGCLMTNEERQAYAKRCDNKFIVGVKYKATNSGKVYIVESTDNGQAVLRPLDGGTSLYVDLKNKNVGDMIPVVGEI